MEIVKPIPLRYRIWTCSYCEKEFTRIKVYKGRTPKYCSMACSGLSVAIKKTCKNCGEEFYNWRNKYFCSMECAGAFKQGKSFPDYHVKALSEAKKGKPIKHFIENKAEVSAKISKALTGKPIPSMRGKNHPNYKDGGKAKWHRQKAMGRVEYKNWRRAVYERDDYTCQVCNEKGGKLNADHIKSWSEYPELRYCINNGRTLCVECHRKTENYGGRRKKEICGEAMTTNVNLI